MDDMKDLYGVLGITRDVNQSTIRSAFKARACERHPDKPEGSTEAFQELNEAYSILSDPDKRARYDHNESVENVPDVNKLAMAQLAELFSQAVEHAKDSFDMISAIRGSVTTGISGVTTRIEQTQKKLAGYEKTAKRVKYSGEGDSNVFAGVIDSKVRQCKGTIEQLEKDLVMGGLVLGYLDEYECAVTKSQVYSPGGFTGLTNTSTGFY